MPVHAAACSMRIAGLCECRGGLCARARAEGSALVSRRRGIAFRWVVLGFQLAQRLAFGEQPLLEDSTPSSGTRGAVPVWCMRSLWQARRGFSADSVALPILRIASHSGR